ncbi:MAG: Fe-S protein assembly co-chaperone HscB [Gammaproteobacteria bacterium]|nr:Fe-S protein assembly co-chaperone HscB [Gammaproteobacteria bacterium]
MADLSSHFFHLFDLPVSFDVDAETLAARYRELQQIAHPDKFVGGTDAERRISVQMAARINEGFRTLKDPLARGRYLLELKGISLDDADTVLDGTFLMEQIELRESMGDVRDSADPHQALQQVSQDIAARKRQITDNMAHLLREDDLASLQQARDETRKLQFFRRLEEELDVLDEELAEF